MQCPNTKKLIEIGIFNKLGFLTSESFGNCVSVSGKCMKKRQTWNLLADIKSTDCFYITNFENSYLATDKFGSIKCMDTQNDAFNLKYAKFSIVPDKEGIKNGWIISSCNGRLYVNENIVCFNLNVKNQNNLETINCIWSVQIYPTIGSFYIFSQNLKKYVTVDHKHTLHKGNKNKIDDAHQIINNGCINKNVNDGVNEFAFNVNINGVNQNINKTKNPNGYEENGFKFKNYTKLVENKDLITWMQVNKNSEEITLSKCHCFTISPMYRHFTKMTNGNDDSAVKKENFTCFLNSRVAIQYVGFEEYESNEMYLNCLINNQNKENTTKNDQSVLPNFNFEPRSGSNAGLVFKNASGHIMSYNIVDNDLCIKNTEISKYDTFLIQSCPILFALIIKNKFVSINQGIDLRASESKFSEKETYTLELANLKNETWKISHNKSTIALSPQNGVQISKISNDKNSAMKITWNDNGTISMYMIETEKYIMAKDNGILYAQSDTIDTMESFKFLIINRKKFYLFTRNYGYIYAKEIECDWVLYSSCLKQKMYTNYHLFGLRHGKNYTKTFLVCYILNDMYYTYAHGKCIKLTKDVETAHEISLEIQHEEHYPIKIKFLKVSKYMKIDKNNSRINLNSTREEATKYYW